MTDTSILVLAPQPFFVHRGTPIAVFHLVETLARDGFKVDLLSYPLGESPSLPGVNLIRSNCPLPFKQITAGFSFKKLILDMFFFFKAWYLLTRKKYKIVHGVEEAAVIALILGFFFDFKLVFDMDSSIPEQMAERFPSLKNLFSPIQWLEEKALRKAEMTFAVCPYLAEKAKHVTPEKVVLLTDFSLVPFSTRDTSNIRSLRELSGGKPLYLYVGNLEKYQGIELALKGFAVSAKQGLAFHFICMGGEPAHRLFYEQMADSLGIARQVSFLAGCPVTELIHYLTQADVLVSPRMTGKNTPMKVYTYMDSGVAILATRIESHLQILTDETACLVDPTPESFAKGVSQLNSQENLKLDLGLHARKKSQESYQIEHYRSRLLSSYHHLIRSQ